jgi:hypothetical protein
LFSEAFAGITRQTDGRAARLRWLAQRGARGLQSVFAKMNSADFIAWSCLVVGLIGMAAVGLATLDNRRRHKRHLRKLRDEADRRRDDYSVFLRELDGSESPSSRPRFLP